MRVVHVSTFERSGGAARAAQRLHHGLQAHGIDSRMLVRRRESSDRAVEEVPVDRREAATWSAIERRWIQLNRTDVSNTWFSTGRPGSDLSAHPWIGDADVVHLHWVPGLAASRDIASLFSTGKPVVWTLHDEWAYTGGCHFTAGCDRWRARCTACPQLREDPHRLVQATFDDKVADLKGGRLVVAAPSRWLLERAESSVLLGGRPGHVVEHGIDLSVWHPRERSARRAAFGLGDDTKLLLFTAGDVSERRKGLDVLLEALARLDPGAIGVPISVAILGVCGPTVIEHARRTLAFPVLACGTTETDAETAAVFAAADLFVIPSREDNMPNTIVEAFACATPVVGSAAGGIPEALQRQSFEASAAVGDAGELAARIREFLDRAAHHESLRREARQIAEAWYGLDRHVREYLSLYRTVSA